MAEQKKKEIPDQAKKLRIAVDNVLRTADGRILFGYLFQRCGYNKPTRAVDPRTNLLDVQSSLHHQSTREVYVDLRKLGAPSLIRAAEAEAEDAEIKEQKKEEK